MTVGPSVGPSVTRFIYFFFVQLFRRFLSITAPAQPHATYGHVSGLVCCVVVDVIFDVVVVVVVVAVVFVVVIVFSVPTSHFR